jgi:hypothetical protein
MQNNFFVYFVPFVAIMYTLAKPRLGCVNLFFRALRDSEVKMNPYAKTKFLIFFLGFYLFFVF